MKTPGFFQPRILQPAFVKPFPSPLHIKRIICCDSAVLRNKSMHLKTACAEDSSRRIRKKFALPKIDHGRLLTVPATTQSANCRGAKAEFHRNFSGSFRDISAFCPAAVTPILLRRNRIGTDLSDLFRSIPFTTSEERCRQRHLPILVQHVPCTQQEQPPHRSS